METDLSALWTQQSGDNWHHLSTDLDFSQRTDKNQIDHLLVTRQHRTSVQHTRVMRGADIASDHQLVHTTLKLKLKRKQQQNKARRKFDTIKLKQPNIRSKFTIELRNRFDVLSE